MRIARIKFNSHAEGPRTNTTLWAAGCSLRCRGCFNPELWARQAGGRYRLSDLLQVVAIGRQRGDRGVAFVGGEPFDQPWALLAALAALRARFPETVLTVYSGYRLEELLRHPARHAALWLADILVDGRFEPRLARSGLGYRGSANQRVIRLKPSRRRAFRRLVLARWDGLIALTPAHLSAPPVLAPALGLTGLESKTEECGRLREGVRP